nr:reverse transcriptase domain-containing protein [Tanacetum cinerariifolium]
MSTRSSARNLFPPLDNPELTIRRRSHSDPTLLNNSEMAAEGNGDLPIRDLWTIEELCQPSLNGRGGPIAPISIQATNFGLKNDMIQQSIKVNGVTDYALRLNFFPHSLTHHATAWFDRLLRNSINTFEQMAKMFLGKYFPPSMVTKLKNKITNSRQRPDESLFEAWERYKLSIDRCPNYNTLTATQIDTFYNGLTLRHRDTINAAAGGTFMKRLSHRVLSLLLSIRKALKAEMAEINKNLMRVLQVNQQVKAVTPNCETCGGPHSFSDFPATVGNTQNVYAAGAYQGIKETIILRGTTKEETNSYRELTKAYDAILKNMQTNMTSLTNSNLELKNMFGQFMKMNTASSSGSGTLPGNTITNLKEDLKGITTRRGTAYPGPTIPTTTSSPVVERETEATKDTVHPTNNGSTKDVQPSVVPTESPTLTSEPINSPIIKPVPVASPVSAPRPNQRPSIPYPSRLQDQKLRDKANDQREKFFQIFKDLNFNISFADALILMQKFGPSIKSLWTNKDKLCELARTPLNEHCSEVLLNKLPKKLGDLGKFLIPCDFLGMVEYIALADLGASINLMPLSVWNKLFYPDLSPTCMTLELADRLISRPVGVAEDVYVKVGTFHFPADLVVIDFDADPRVPLILGRSFIKTTRALIDVFEGKLTLHVGKEAITFNLDQTSRYSANYNDMMAKRIDVIDMAYEEYSQEVLGFSDVKTSSNPTPYYDPIISTTSPTLTPFGNIDFLLEEVDAFLALEDDPTSSKVDQSYLDTEGDILILESFLNDDPSLPPQNQGNYLPEVRKELKICDDKLPVIIAKYLSMEEKTAHITVLKSHKRAIAWKLFDIKGIDPEFCTHKILTEEDFEPAVQHQRKVNPKIHDVIKQEVLKLLDAGLIYPISDSPWVSPVYRVPKKGGFTVVENEENELILTRLVMGWRVCIDYHQEKTTFTRLYRTFAYRRMPFGLCNAPGTFQRCMMAIFHDMIEKTIEVFMDDFSVFGNSFQSCLSHLEKMLKRPIHYANKTITEAESNYTTTKKEMLAVVYAFKKYRSYLIINKCIMYTDHSALKYLFAKKDSKARLLRWVLLLQEFTFKVIDTKGTENMAIDHLSRLENPHQNMLDPKELNESFPLRHLIWFLLVFAKVMQKFGVTHRLATPYHPQISGQVEVSNRGLKRILERTVRENRASWSDKLDDALWKVQLSELNELRDQVYENSLIYKEKNKRLHDSKIKDRVFNIGDRVLLFNSRLKIFFGKIKSRWSGPFTISHVFPYGTVGLSQPDGPNFKVNGHRLKHYFGEDVPKMVVPNLQTFPKDH